MRSSRHKHTHILSSYRAARYEEMQSHEDEGFGPSSSGNGNTGSSLGHLGDKIVRLVSEIMSKSRVARVVVALVSCMGLGTLLYASWSARLSSVHFLWVGMFGFYAYVTEVKRLRAKDKEIKQLREKCRKLVKARRAAGLLRLEKDTRMRREHWPAPPHSGAKAYLYKEVDTMDSPKLRRQVDYKKLCVQIAQELLQHKEVGTTSSSSASSSLALSTGNTMKSLFRLLSQAGPEPVKDPELYRDMHLALDEVEKQLRMKPSKDFYCRLCLGYQNGDQKSSPVTLKCGHHICRECALSLVESSIGGTIGVPISCPVGCNSLMSPQMLRSILSDDLFERFQRIHTVKMSLQASAPHVRSLASELAEARKGLAKTRERRDSKEKSLSPELTIRTGSSVKESSSSGSRFSDTSILNHRARFK